MKKFTTICVFLSLIIGFRLFIGEICVVNTHSMTPTILPTEVLFYNKLSYGAILPKRWGDIPVINFFTWFTKPYDKDRKNNWGYHRLYGLKKPRTGDIIVFFSPENEKHMLIKRIRHILYKGTTIPFNKENHNLIKEIAIKDGHQIECDHMTFFIDDKPINAYTVEQNYYYVLGDNKMNSWDSKNFGYIKEENIVGHVCLRVLSFSNKGIRWERILRFM